MATPFGPELEFPPDDFSSVTPAELAAASAEMEAEDEIQFPAATFDDVTPEALAAARAELAAEAGTLEGYAGGDPFAVLRAPSAEQPFIGFPTNPDLAPPVEPEPLPPVDAITGVGPTPASPMAPGLGIPEDMFQAAMRGVPMETQGTPELPEEYLTNQEAGIAYAMQSPEQQLNQQLDLEQRRSDMQRTALAKASKADAEEAERDERDWRTSRETSRRDIEQIEAEAKAEAGREIDINRGWANASTGTKIAGIFSALAGGLVAHKYGGRNSGLEMIDNLINRDIDAQKFNKSQRVNDLTRRGASARDRLAMAGDDFREETRLRLTSYDRVLGQIASDAQNFDPRGTQAIRYGQAYQDLAAKRAQTAADAQKRIADQYKEQLDFAGKELDLLTKKAALAKAQRAAMGGGGGGSGASGRLTPGQWAATQGENGRPPTDMTAKEYDQWIARGNKLSQGAFHSTQAAKAARENSPEWIAGDLGVSEMVNEDGSPTLYRDADDGKRIAKLKASVDTVARLIDQIKAARAKYGWSSDLAKSDEWRRIKSDNAALTIAAKTLAELGVLAGPDMEIIAEMKGTSDPTEMRDPTAGLLQMRSNAILGFNEEARASARVGQRPKAYNIAEADYGPPTESAGDREFKAAMTKPGFGDVVNAAEAGYVRPDDEDDIVLPAVLRTIGRLATVAKTGKTSEPGKTSEREIAHKQLEKLYSDGPTRGVRNAAGNALLTVGQPDIVDGGPRQATVKDEISQPVSR